MEIINKYNAIFELNNKSPLFARVANDKLSKGNVNDALLILKKGIEIFENYPTPYFILGKVFIKLNRIDEAKDAFEQGHKLLSNSATYNHYTAMLDEKETANPFDVLEEISNKNTLSTDENESAENNFEEEIPTEENLDELAEKLKTAKIDIKNEVTPVEENSESDSEFKPIKGLVSETLASIYFNQSNYKEAKAIYETLIEIQPERAEYFKNKIAEIESHMRPR